MINHVFDLFNNGITKSNFVSVFNIYLSELVFDLEENYPNIWEILSEIFSQGIIRSMIRFDDLEILFYKNKFISSIHQRDALDE